MRVLLLLFICISVFLAGMVFGGNQQTMEPQPPVEVVKEITKPNTAQVEEVIAIQDPSQINFTQKTASFLEGAVNGLYDFIVALLYEIASIFFSVRSCFI